MRAKAAWTPSGVHAASPHEKRCDSSASAAWYSMAGTRALWRPAPRRLAATRSNWCTCSRLPVAAAAPHAVSYAARALSSASSCASAMAARCSVGSTDSRSNSRCATSSASYRSRPPRAAPPRAMRSAKAAHSAVAYAAYVSDKPIGTRWWCAAGGGTAARSGPRGGTWADVRLVRNMNGGGRPRGVLPPPSPTTPTLGESMPVKAALSPSGGSKMSLTRASRRASTSPAIAAASAGRPASACVSASSAINRAMRTSRNAYGRAAASRQARTAAASSDVTVGNRASAAQACRSAASSLSSPPPPPPPPPCLLGKHSPPSHAGPATKVGRPCANSSSSTCAHRPSMSSTST